VGSPTYVREIADVYHHLPAADQPTAAVITSNYGEAGAVDLYGPAFGLPHAFSGHSGYWYWGPPPATARTIVRLGTRLDNHLRIENDEQGATVWVCSQPRDGWPTLWPQFRSLG